MERPVGCGHGGDNVSDLGGDCVGCRLGRCVGHREVLECDGGGSGMRKGWGVGCGYVGGRVQCGCGRICSVMSRAQAT